MDTPEPIQPTPELLEWVKAQFTDEEVVAGLRELLETGGLTFADVIRALDLPNARG